MMTISIKKLRMLFPILAVFQIIFQTNIHINLLHQERKRIYFETLNAIESTSTSTAVNKADDGIKSPHNDHENLKVMLYVTTHMSPQHIWYLKSCWLPALQNSVLLRNSDVVVYLNPTNDTKREEAKQLLKGTFQNQNLTIYDRSNPGPQEGAKSAISDAAQEGRWFNGYDWVIRVNPDVIIRDDTFMMDVMQNDPNATAILINCHGNYDAPKVKVHTDFFAIKPGALRPNNFLNSTHWNAETAFTEDISTDILKKGNHRWIEGAQPRNRMCRAGYGRGERDKLHITHFHVEETWLNNFTCPIPF